MCGRNRQTDRHRERELGNLRIIQNPSLHPSVVTHTWSLAFKNLPLLSKQGFPRLLGDYHLYSFISCPPHYHLWSDAKALIKSHPNLPSLIMVSYTNAQYAPYLMPWVHCKLFSYFYMGEKKTQIRKGQEEYAEYPGNRHQWQAPRSFSSAGLEWHQGQLL